MDRGRASRRGGGCVMDRGTEPVGVAAGRFQVLHNDHLRYLLAARQLCAHLIVGITNPDPHVAREDAADLHRTDPQANPLTYFERYQLVRAALPAAGVPEREFSVVPLPISFPELYRYYVPLDALFVVSIYDDWGRRKLDFFQSQGLRTHILWDVCPEEKGISGAQVRALMRSGGDWRSLVPPAVADLLSQWRICERLSNL